MGDDEGSFFLFSKKGRPLGRTALSVLLGEPHQSVFPPGLSAAGPSVSAAGTTHAASGDRWWMNYQSERPSVARIGPDGEKTKTFRARHPDGRIAGSGAVVVSPADGGVWVAGRHALMRLDQDGVVERSLGTLPDPTALSRVDYAAVGLKGTLYLVDAGTAVVHVFDRQGRPLRRLTPAEEDFKDGLGFAELAVTPDGTVYLGSALMGDRYIRFAPDGRRLGPVPAGIRGDKVQVTNRWRFRPDGDRWTLHQDSVDLVRENGKGGRWERRIERRPDGEYFGIALNFAVFPDSELLVTDDE
ncbi:MAG: hypothetical protein AAF907_07345, partial [Planctomycetota bacterium]